MTTHATRKKRVAHGDTSERDPSVVPESSKTALREAMRLEKIPTTQFQDLLWIMTPLVLAMTPIFHLLTATAFALTATAARAEPPPFSRFRVSENYIGPVAKPVFHTTADREFRTRLNAAAKQPVNFAGRYVLSTWGCGAQCLMGVILDARSGRVTWLPFTVCCFQDTTKAPIEFRRDSSLLVIRGMRNEEGENGTFYYQYDHDNLRLISDQPGASD